MIQPKASLRVILFLSVASFGLSLPAGLHNGTQPGARQTADLMRWTRQQDGVDAIERSIILPTLRSMSLEQKLGQMLMVGFSGTNPEDAIRFVRAYRVGGLVLFKANVKSAEQCRKMIDGAQEYSLKHNGSMLLVATDQEGGSVVTIKNEICPGFPSNEEIGLHKDPLAVLNEQARQTAVVFRDLGLNMNLAPVVDVLTMPENKVIGKRSYGSNSYRVAELAAEYVTVLQSSGIIATAKHFPGHGATAGDSHRELPVVSIPGEQMRRLHLLPFERVIAAGVAAIMTAHVVYECFDDQPATMSRKLLHECLREQLGFKGVVITDSLEMDAITGNFAFENAVVDSVNAGADIILIARDDSLKLRAWSALRMAASTGRLSKSRIDEAVSRILRLKLDYGLLSCD